MEYRNDIEDINLVSNDLVFLTWAPHELDHTATCETSGEWEDCFNAKPPYIVTTAQSTRKEIRPLTKQKNNQSFFTDFLNMDPSDENFLQYADKYGPLFHETDPLLLKHYSKLAIHPTQSIRFWRRMHWWIKTATELSILITDKKRSHKLTEIFKIENNPSPLFEEYSFSIGPKLEPDHYCYEECPSIATHKMYSIKRTYNSPEEYTLSGFYLISSQKEWRGFGEADGLIKPATVLLRDIVWYFLHKYPVSSAPSIERGKIVADFSPSSLLALLWYTVLQQHVGEKKYKRCHICGKLADVTGFNSSWKQHDSCINNANRKMNYKLDQIDKYQAKGFSLSEVAARIKLSVDEIEELLSDRETRRNKRTKKR